MGISSLYGEWSVDAAGVAGVLALVDDEGNALETVDRDFTTLESEGGTLSVSGRSTMSRAFRNFCDEREEVPNMLMWMIQHRGNQVIEASVAVIAGDAEMSTNVTDAETYAREHWNIESTSSYNADLNPFG